MPRPLFLIPLVLTGLSLNFANAQTPTPTDPPAAAQTSPTSADTPGLKATQVTVTIDKDGKQRRFRATVLARKEEGITLLTAAHCMSEADKDAPVTLIFDGELAEGSVESVVRNPSYQSKKNYEIPGADNAIARLHLKKPTNKSAIKAFEALKPATTLAAQAYPGPDGQTVSVHMIDGRGVEHALKAGNHRNPRYLEWGLAYKPIPGDSGGGVFVIRQAANGEPQAILIGTIVGQDDRGGAASLVSRQMRWIDEELTR
jgi:hypothetical protein